MCYILFKLESNTTPDLDQVVVSDVGLRAHAGSSPFRTGFILFLLIENKVDFPYCI